MKTLQSQRALYLKTVEAAGSVEVLDVVQTLEKKTLEIDIDRCKQALTDYYVRNGSFPEYPLVLCATEGYTNCKPELQTRVKQYYEQRNPDFFVSCRETKHKQGWCEATPKTESLFKDNE